MLGNVALDLLVAAGRVLIELGVFFRLEIKNYKDSPDTYAEVHLGGYLRVTGRLSVLGLISITAELYADGPGFPLGPGHERVYTSQERPARFRWVSSDTTVLRVDAEGLARGVSPGESVVTAQVGERVSRGVRLTVQEP